MTAPERVPSVVLTPSSTTGVLLRFPEGLLGFPGESHFTLFEGRRPGLFFLQGMGPNAPSFVLADPFTFFPGYDVELAERDLSVIDATHASQIGVLAVTVPDRRTGLWTANLQGPLVVNVTHALGAQIVLARSAWSVRQPFTPTVATPTIPPSAAVRNRAAAHAADASVQPLRVLDGAPLDQSADPDQEVDRVTG